MDQLLWQDATAQAEAIRAGEVSAVELLDAYLDRIEVLDPILRAYVTVDADGSRAAAVAVDAQRGLDPSALPPFAGVALSIKDSDDVAGLPTTHSCEVLADHVAATDAPAVHRLRASGAVIVGKSNVPEFNSDLTNSRLNGICRNPWDTGRSAGGSSGGAAAALAGGLCAVSHGTDGAGSIRVPSSWCGVVGVKPTRGLVAFGPEDGNPYYGTSVPGVLVRSVRDAAAMLDVLAPVSDPWTPSRARSFATEAQLEPGRLRVAVCTTFPLGDIDPEVASAVDDAGRLVESLGHAVERAGPDWPVVLAASGGPLSVPGAAGLVSLEDAHRLEPRNQATLVSLAALTVLEHSRWVDAARAASRDFLEFWDDVDVLVTPTVGVVAPTVDWAPWDDSPAAHGARFATFPNFAHPFNVTGQPALSLPLAWSSTGLPIGVQLVGPRLGDATLLRLATQLEQAAPWIERIAAAARALPTR